VCALFASVVLLSLVSCASGPKTKIIQLTPNLITELGVETMEKFAYYVSKNVELVRQGSKDDAVQFQAGDVVRKDINLRESVLIDTKTPGAETVNLFMQVAFVNYHVVGVEFEDIADAKIGFAADLRDPEGRYQLQFDDDAARTIRYAGYDYQVRYKGDERPYLMIRTAVNVAKEHLRRKAAGKKFE
jgi:hypothetical protein